MEEEKEDGAPRSAATAGHCRHGGGASLAAGPCSSGLWEKDDGGVVLWDILLVCSSWAA